MGVSKAGAYRTNNLTDFVLRRRIRDHAGDPTAVIHNGGHTSYQALQSLTNKVSNGLKARGVQPGDRVMIGLPDCPAFAAALFGIVQMGAVAVMMNHRNPEAFSALARDAGAQVIIGAPGEGRVGFVELTQGQSELCAVHPVDPRADAIWLYSSGSTSGQQKLVRQSHGSYLAVTENLALKHMGMQCHDRTLSVPPLNFGYATGLNLIFPLAAGGVAILDAEASTPERIFALAKAHRPTILVNTPTAITKMLDWAADHKDDVDLSSLRMMTSAGEALKPALYDRWHARFPNVPLVDAIGFAEHWHFLTMNGPDNHVAGTLGTMIPGLRVKVCVSGKPRSRQVADGQVGHLWVKGPAMANGYYNDPEATAKAFVKGWFISGDLVSLSSEYPDGQPRLTYHGRADDRFKVSGQWVTPVTIANRLIQHPAVEDAAVFRFEQRDVGKPMAFIVLRDEHDVDAEALQQFVIEALAPYMCPQRFEFQHEPFALNNHNKTDTAALRARI